MHNNEKYCEYHLKILKYSHVTEELSMDIDPRPRNMASEGNTVIQEAFW